MGNLTPSIPYPLVGMWSAQAMSNSGLPQPPFDKDDQSERGSQFPQPSTKRSALSPHAIKQMQLPRQCVPYTPPPVFYEVHGEERRNERPLEGRGTAFSG